MKTWELYVSHHKKEKDLHNLKLMVMCYINLIQSKEKEVKLTNNSIVKPKTAAFLTNEDYEYCNIDTIINKIELLQCVKIMVKVIHTEGAQSSRNLMMQEYLVTDDGENIIPLTMFENLKFWKKIPHTKF